MNDQARQDPAERISRAGGPPSGRATESDGTAVLKAVGLVLLAGLLFAVMNTLVKSMTGRIDTVLLIWARYFFHVMFVVIFFPRSLTTLFRVPQLGVQFWRSILLLGSTILNFIALGLMPLGEVAAITFTSPILVAALAATMLREEVTLWRWLAILLGFAGALLVVRPSGEMNIGALLAFLCAFCFAFYQISTRLVREAQPILSLLFGGLVGMVGMSFVVPFFWHPISLLDTALLVAIGFLGAIGHLFVIMALQRAEASKVSPFTYAQLVWAMLLGFLVFGDVPTMATIIGALIIVASGLWVFRLDMRRRRPAASGGARIDR